MSTVLCLALAMLGGQEPATLTGHTREVWSLAISPDGKTLASGSTDLTVKLWDTSNNNQIGTLEGHDGAVFALAFSPDGKTLASGEMYMKLRYWDVESKKETKMLKHTDGRINGLAYSPDGKKLYGASTDSYFRIWDAGKDAEPKKFLQRYEVLGVAVSKDGKWIATPDGHGTVKIWDPAGKELKTLEHSGSGKANCAAFSADGKWLATGGSELVKLWDTATWTEKTKAKFDANALAFTPDGSTIVCGTQDNLVVFLDAGNLDVKGKYEKHERPVTAIAITPDGKTAYSASQDMTIKAWAIK